MRLLEGRRESLVVEDRPLRLGARAHEVLDVLAATGDRQEVLGDDPGKRDVELRGERVDVDVLVVVDLEVRLGARHGQEVLQVLGERLAVLEPEDHGLHHGEDLSGRSREVELGVLREPLEEPEVAGELQGEVLDRIHSELRPRETQAALDLRFGPVGTEVLGALQDELDERLHVEGAERDRDAVVGHDLQHLALDGPREAQDLPEERVGVATEA